MSKSHITLALAAVSLLSSGCCVTDKVSGLFRREAACPPTSPCPAPSAAYFPPSGAFYSGMEGAPYAADPGGAYLPPPSTFSGGPMYPPGPTQ